MTTAITSKKGSASFIASWISLDAVVVLSGAVLTSYVGVTGLLRRMSLDLCLPQFLLRRNSARGTNHWIILSFLGMCASILALTAGRIEQLAGVYTLSFLSVMGLFGVGNLLLRRRYPKLMPPSASPRRRVVVAIFAVAAALVGNVLLDEAAVRVFGAYFAVALGLISLALLQTTLLKRALQAVRMLLGRPTRLGEWASARIHAINCRTILFFPRVDEIAVIRAAARYVLENESIRHLKVVWTVASGADVPPSLAALVETVDREHPELRISLMLVEGRLEPSLFHALAEHLGVPLNYFFLSTASSGVPPDLPAYGGVRLLPEGAPP